MQARKTLNRLKLAGLFTVTLLTSLSGSFYSPAHASCDKYLGRASTGAGIRLDECSIDRISGQRVEFTYYLGSEQLAAEADCVNRSWIVYPERIRIRPSSRATQTMLRNVCNTSGTATYYRAPNRRRRSGI